MVQAAGERGKRILWWYWRELGLAEGQIGIGVGLLGQLLCFKCLFISIRGVVFEALVMCVRHRLIFRLKLWAEGLQWFLLCDIYPYVSITPNVLCL